MEDNHKHFFEQGISISPTSTFRPKPAFIFPSSLCIKSCITIQEISEEIQEICSDILRGFLICSYHGNFQNCFYFMETLIRTFSY